ncbi:hypothetical protein BKP57_06350 [Virgibacillus sp. 6R]|nr:hypothetical protein BKP57_06350 [Virgibacillus sp. 6R]
MGYKRKIHEKCAEKFKGTAVDKFQDEIIKQFFKWMNRRSQRNSFTWEKFRLFLRKYPLPKPKIKVNIYELREHISYIL